MAKRSIQAQLKQKVVLLLEQQSVLTAYQGQAGHSDELVGLMKSQVQAIEREIVDLAKQAFGSAGAKNPGPQPIHHSTKTLNPD